ncbi:hypothetical protein DSO57_1038318 [Entomophthora muscae]|uniref:Uncharacterized protein n=1 Tax=Entomophthora muscae TaxID=34485 RepID=A0ACC2T9X4_9FUNG|nr:hypothetical protein DSO57_1038318 [Entomophthora muscae]
MKFGTQLNGSLYSEWRFYYVDYDGLKRLIKPKQGCSFKEEDESKFVEFLQKDLEKVSSFQKIKLGELNRRIQHCEILVDSLAKQPDASVEAYQSAQDEINRVIPEVNELAKFSRMNYTGFLKIIKKHDKHTGYVLKPMFMVRLNSKPFFNENFDALLLKLSRLYALVRQDDPSTIQETVTSPKHTRTRVCRTVKYWVHPDNVMELKLYVLKHLPVLLYTSQANGSGKVDPRISSIYLDNDDFDVYTNRIEKKENSPTFCLSWFGAEDNVEVFVERKMHREDWTGETHSKHQFKIKEKYVDGYLRGEPVMKKTIDKLRRSNELPAPEVDSLENLAEEIQMAVIERKLKPILRTFYNRTAFQMPGESFVRITLDTEVTMIREDNYDTPRSGEHWRRRDVGAKYPFSGLPPSDIVRFPFAVLEVKLEMAAGSTTPGWVDHLINSHLVEPVPNFSKYIHGVASLLENRVPLLPFWLPQMDKDIRRAPSPSFRFASQKSLSTKMQQVTSDDVRIDVDQIPFRRQTPSDLKKPLRQKSLDAGEQTPLLGTSTSTDARSDLGFFNIFRRGTAQSGTTAASRPIKNKRIAVPVRVEPKVFFANERTFLSWLNFALVLGALAIALVNTGNWVGIISGLLFIAIALIVMVYALLIFQWRAEKIRNREPGPYDDRVGPIILVSCIFIAVTINFGLKFYSLYDNSN